MGLWVIRVTFANGGVAWLRHGPVIGSGPIVRFRSKAQAEHDLETIVKPGLEDGDVAHVVPIAEVN